MQFSDLDFQPHPNWDGVQAKYFFENGYGVSVIQSSQSYGGCDGLYEVAVIQGNSDKWQITYDTPITGDVLGWQTPQDIDDVLNRVQFL